MSGSEFCYYHNPAIKTDEKRRAQSGGGKANKIAVVTPEEPMQITGATHVVKLLESTVNQIRRGTIEIRVANCIGFLSGHLLRALEVSGIEERIDEIERRLEELSHD